MLKINFPRRRLRAALCSRRTILYVYYNILVLSTAYYTQTNTHIYYFIIKNGH